MKKTIFLLFTILTSFFLLPSCSELNGRERTYNIIGFEGVQASSDFDIFIDQGDDFHVYASGDPVNIKDLHVGMTNENAINFYYINGVVKRFPKTQIRITMPTLKGISVSDYCNVQVVGFQSGSISNLDINANIESNISIDAVMDTLKVRMRQQSNLTITGASKKLNIYVEGHSRIEAPSFQVKDARIVAQYESTASIHVTDNLDAQVSTSSQVYYEGDPEVTSVVDETSILKQHP